MMQSEEDEIRLALKVRALLHDGNIEADRLVRDNLSEFQTIWQRLHWVNEYSEWR